MRRPWYAMPAVGIVVALTMGTAAVGAPAAPRSAAGFHVVTVENAGFSVEIPDEWAAIDFTRKDAAAILKGLRKKHPQLAAELPDDIAAAAQRIKLFAIDPSPGERHGNVNALLSGARALPPKKTLQKQYAAGLGKASIVNVRIDGQRGYEISVKGYNQIQFLVIGARGLLIFTFSSSTADDSRDDPTIVTMLESVKLLR